MSVWKRNAVVVAIVLFVGAAVYLNWSYSKEAAEGADGENGGKLLGHPGQWGEHQQGQRGGQE